MIDDFEKGIIKIESVWWTHLKGSNPTWSVNKKGTNIHLSPLTSLIVVFQNIKESLFFWFVNLFAFVRIVYGRCTKLNNFFFI